MVLRQGLLIILSSPSGAGKSTLAKRLIASDREISFSVSATTRPPRMGEHDGKDYHFMRREDFLSEVKKDSMLEHANVFDNLYGSPRAPVEQAVKQGRDIFFDVDWQGGQQIRNSSFSAHVVSIFILPPSISELNTRLKKRAEDNAEIIAGRMAKARSEISHWAEYDYVLINDDLEKSAASLRQIISAERMRRIRQPALQNFVRNLNSEIAEGCI